MNKTDVMICDCGKRMVPRYTGMCLTSYPEQYPWYWWCACGKEKPGGVEVAHTEEDIVRKQWEEANRSGMNTDDWNEDPLGKPLAVMPDEIVAMTVTNDGHLEVKDALGNVLTIAAIPDDPT